MLFSKVLTPHAFTPVSARSDPSNDPSLVLVYERPLVPTVG